MKSEIKTAACFLASLLRLNNTLNKNQLDGFCFKMEDLLRHHYQQHWFPDNPFKGSGYRCLRINHKMDPIIAKAGYACGLEEEDLRHLFPSELTLWIDPKEVSYRIGENGSICILYDANKSQKFQFSECGDQEFYNCNHSNENILYSSSSTSLEISRATCKESMRNKSWDGCIREVRTGPFEQMATYVSS